MLEIGPVQINMILFVPTFTMVGGDGKGRAGIVEMYCGGKTVTKISIILVNGQGVDYLFGRDGQQHPLRKSKLVQWTLVHHVLVGSFINVINKFEQIELTVLYESVDHMLARVLIVEIADQVESRIINFNEMAFGMQGIPAVVSAYQNRFLLWGVLDGQYGRIFIPIGIILAEFMLHGNILRYGNLGNGHK